MLSRIQAKIVGLANAQAQIASWQSKGDTIVWTNGCFDLLHRGHLIYLAEAKALGDRLVVGLNSDQSVRDLKGFNRPILDLQSRQLQLAAMAATDLIITFDESTPLKMIEAIRPNIIVKGGDYQASEVVGAHEVQKWGGVVKIIPFLEGYSTSAIIKKIKEA